ncbi:guanine nucleotide-binding protein-like 3 [Lepisosteus oculatus]|uniref:guanine nucleotide-binding protein-like 3 n=1 Tax=Lepisosteus oculatus TaxID=7918 RepID=UPI003717A62D
MKRPKLKKASKRLSCAKRYKIQKKVREHNRKLRKVAKKKGAKRAKKDLGVPNNAPFKEDILKEAEQRKLKLEELKEKQKLTKKKEREKKRKLEVASNDPDVPVKKSKREAPGKLTKGKDRNSRKVLCRELNKVIDASDVILEVLDARDPMGCRCPQLEENVLKHEGKKQLLLVLNKIDLVPKDNVEKWLQCLQLEFPTVAFKSSTRVQDKTVQEKKKRADNGVIDLTRGVTCVGNTCLLQLLEDYCQTHKQGNTVKVGIVGFPNVGKSSLINSMRGVPVCNVGVQRGITKCMQEVHISNHVKMIDSPGIIVAPSSCTAAVALRGLPETHQLQNPQDAVASLLKNCNKQQIMLQYTVPDFRNSLEFLTCFAKKRGFLQKGGIPDMEKAAATFLSDWTGAKLSYHSKPPEGYKLPFYLSDTVVAMMQKSWERDKLQKGNMATIAGVKCPTLASSVVYLSPGATSGLVNESDLGEKEDFELYGEEEELEFIDIVPQPKKSLKEKKESGKLQAKTLTKSNKKAIGVPSQQQLPQIPVQVDISTAKQDDDMYDFNIDFN